MGKSELLYGYIRNDFSFNISMIFVPAAFDIEVDSKVIKAEIWDTCESCGAMCVGGGWDECVCM